MVKDDKSNEVERDACKSDTEQIQPNTESEIWESREGSRCPLHWLSKTDTIEITIFKSPCNVSW